MSKVEDAYPLIDYPYSWFPESDLPLKDFLSKYKPSMVQDDGTKPWLWLHKLPATSEETYDHSDAAVEEAKEYLVEITAKIESIKNDDSISVRANKKKGIKSKKELREELQNEAASKLKDISARHGFVSGKWLIFASSERVDLIWSTIAASLVEGPLLGTTATIAKVATSPKNETPNYQHVLCLYMPNIYDKDSVLGVMRVLLAKHGVNLMGVKSNLYTTIGLDSKHASGIQSTIWRNTALMSEADMKELKNQFFADLNSSKATVAEQPAETKNVVDQQASKPKPKLRRKAADIDPFVSDNEDDASNAGTSMGTAQKQSKPKLVKKRDNRNDFVSDDENDDIGKKQHVAGTKEQPASRLKRDADRKRVRTAESDDDDEPRPRKKQSSRK